MDFELTILGAGAALPARGRHPSAQLLMMGGKGFLIDCGEGTQERLRYGKHNLQRIERIFISHMHGDHYLGLMGLISTMHLLGRTKPLYVHGPEELEGIVHLQLKASRTYLRYDLHFLLAPDENGVVLYEDHNRRVTSLSLKHRIPCTGFKFEELNRLRKLKKDMVHLIPHFKRKEVQQGADLILEDGKRISNEDLTEGEPHVRSYAYCSDTAYVEELVPYLKGVDLLYHEATFTEALTARATETHHSTAMQAALVAKQAGVRMLLLGHFSSRYKHLDQLLDEAVEVFPNAELAEEATTYALLSDEIVKKSK